MHQHITVEAEGHGTDKIKDLGEGKKILDILEKYYPGHDWFVNVSHFAGFASIQLMYAHPDGTTRIWKWGMGNHLHKLAQMSASEYESKIMRDGGELLERYGMSRAAINEKSIVDYFSKKSVDTAGMIN